MRQLNSHDLNWAVRKCYKRIQEVLKKYPGKVFAAGGYVRSTIVGEVPSDIDLFVPTKSEALALAHELGNRNKVLETDNAYTITNFFDNKPLPYPIQIIHRWTFNNPTDMLNSFDFSIATASFWFDKVWQSMCSDEFYEDLAAKRLTYHKPIRNEDAGGSLLRVLKFYQKGYRIPLEDLGAVIARLTNTIDEKQLDISTEKQGVTREQQIAKIVTGLLREVDPNIDVNEMTDTF